MQEMKQGMVMKRLPVWECRRKGCEHIWLPRKDEVPSVCPKCHCKLVLNKEKRMRV